LFFADKRKEIKHQRRISEKYAPYTKFFRSSLGAGIGMLIFMHKVSKKIFMIKFFGVLVFQVISMIIFYQKFKQIYI